MKTKKPKTKKVAKKVIKKKTKKVVKKAVKKFIKKVLKTVAPKIIKKSGEVLHFYGGISVAIVKCMKPLKVGQKIRLKGATTDFVCSVESIQYEHLPLTEAKAGQEVGVRVADKVREGDEIFFVE